MTSDDLVSVVVPAFDAARWLGEALDSCARQTHRAIDVIVVDDGSSDDTGAVARAFAARDPDRFRLLRIEHAGPGAARNAGVREARGRFLYFLDADDLAEPGALAHAVVRIRLASADAIVGDWHDFGARGSAAGIPRAGTFRYPGDPVASVVFRPVVLSAVLFARNSIRFDETVMRCEGMRYIWDAFLALPRVEYLAEPFVRVRQRSDAERLTIKHDHFEPAYNFELHLDFKVRLRATGSLTPEREEAIDYRLLHHAYAALLRGEDVPRSADAFDPRRLSTYSWFEPFSVAGCARALGLRRGLKVAHAINRWLGRV